MEKVRIYAMSAMMLRVLANGSTEITSVLATRDTTEDEDAVLSQFTLMVLKKYPGYALMGLPRIAVVPDSAIDAAYKSLPDEGGR
jgi:hypothetical protein